MCAWRIQRREINSSYEANERRTVHDSLVSFLFVNFLLENTFFPILCRFTHISFQALCFLYFISSLYRASHIILDYLQYLTPISSVFSYLSAILSSVFSHLSAVLSCVFSYLSAILSGVFSYLSAVLSSVFSYLFVILSSVFSYLSAVLSCVFSYLSLVLSSVFSYLSPVLSSVFSYLSAVLSSVFSYLSPVLSSALYCNPGGKFKRVSLKETPLSFLFGIYTSSLSLF